MTPSDVATLIKESVDILEVIGQVVGLRRVGNRHVGLCPFHQEKTPSFHVDPDKGFFYCFGCGEGGDVLKFVMKHWNLNFMEAVRFLADRYRIQLPKVSQYPSQAAEEKKELHKVLESACDYFYGQLHHSSNGKKAREYLRKRLLPETVVEKQRLGYAPEGWDNMVRHLRRCGVDEQTGVRAGLLVQSAHGRIYDRFRDRLIFPITDPNGNIVAFGGRSLDGSEPKYLNSPETPIYHKGRMLYGYSFARTACRTKRELIVVEGYMDLLAFHAHHFFRVVATLGTALTPTQVRLLNRLADEVILVYDADEAGQKAMFRALPLFFHEQLPVSCIHLPDAMDPDDFLTNHGLEPFLELLKKRQDLGLHAIENKLRSWDGTATGKSSVVKEISPLLSQVREPVLYTEYLRVISERLAVPETVIDRQIKQRPRSSSTVSRSTFRRNQPTTGRRRSPGDFLVRSPEETIVQILLHHLRLLDDLEGLEILSYFKSPILKNIAEALLSQRLAVHDDDSVRSIYDLLPSDESRDLFTRLSLDDSVPDELETARMMLHDRLEILKQREMKLRRKQLQAALEEAERAGDHLRRRKIAAQIQALHAASDGHNGGL